MLRFRIPQRGKKKVSFSQIKCQPCSGTLLIFSVFVKFDGVPKDDSNFLFLSYEPFQRLKKGPPLARFLPCVRTACSAASWQLPDSAAAPLSATSLNFSRAEKSLCAATYAAATPRGWRTSLCLLPTCVYVAGRAAGHRAMRVADHGDGTAMHVKVMGKKPFYLLFKKTGEGVQKRANVCVFLRSGLILVNGHTVERGQPQRHDNGHLERIRWRRVGRR